MTLALLAGTTCAGRSPAPALPAAAGGTGLSGVVSGYCPLRAGTTSDDPGGRE
jgi:hypothetical protein